MVYCWQEMIVLEETQKSKPYVITVILLFLLQFYF